MLFFLDHAKLLASIEKLKDSKYSLFPLTGINPGKLEFGGFFFHKMDVDKKNDRKAKGWKK